MKTIKMILIFTLVIGSIKVYAGDIKYTEISNGIILIGTKPKSTFFNGNGFMKVNANNNILQYSLELYSDGNINQYAIKAGLFAGINRKYAFAFPAHSKMLLKLEDDSIIELTAIYNKNITNPSEEKNFEAYFPVSNDQLNQIFSGIKKLRVEIMVLDKDTETIVKDYKDVDFKKDKMGKQIQEWYDEVNKEYKETGLNLLSKSIGNNNNIVTKDITEGF